MLGIIAVREAVAGNWRCEAAPPAQRRFPATPARTAAIPSKELLGFPAVRPPHPHSGDFQQEVAGIARCEATPSAQRRKSATSARTARISSKRLLRIAAVRRPLPHSGDFQQRPPSQRQFPATPARTAPIPGNALPHSGASQQAEPPFAPFGP